MLGLKLPDDSAQDKQGRTKLDRFVTKGMAVARGVIINKVRMHKLGAENACSGKRRKLYNAKHNKKNNPKNNPKKSKKQKDANDEETRIWLKNHPTLSEHVLEKGETEEKAMSILRKPFDKLGKQSIFDVLAMSILHKPFDN